MEKTISVVIVEDQLDIGEHLRAIISATPDLAVHAHFSSAEDALQAGLAETAVDVFLVDLGLPGMSGIHFIAQARQCCPSANFLVHTIAENGDQLWSALAAGAIGYILKGCSNTELVEALRLVALGNTLLSPRMAAKLVRFFSTIADPVSPLTNREMDILNGLKSGQTYEQIATNRFLSPHTVHTHIKNIYQKLSVNNREDAVKKALVFGLLKDKRM